MKTEYTMNFSFLLSTNFFDKPFRFWINSIITNVIIVTTALPLAPIASIVTPGKRNEINDSSFVFFFF